MIHQYKNNDYNIVLDVNSGSVHVVDDVVYDVIPIAGKGLEAGWGEKETEEECVESLKGKHAPEDIRDAFSQIMELKEAQMLFSPDIYENYIVDFKKRQTVVKALCLHIAHDCNLACRYCFAEEGEYHGRRALMSYEVGKKALDFLVANSGNRVNLEVDFFGGEPLLNWQVVKDLVAYGRSLEEPNHKKFRFTLTTNGILLDDEILEFANKEMANLVLSIDGRKEIHDLMRPYRGGQGSYDKVVPIFRKAAESRGQMNYYVRGTFTRNNLDFSKDVMHLADLGFEQISVEPVVASPEDDYALREEDIPALLEEYDRLAAELLNRRKEGKGVNFFHFMIDLEGGPCVAKRLSGCGSGTEYLAVTPWGDLYPCHQFVGKEEFLMGNVFEGIIRTDIRDGFKTCNVYAKEKCRNCFARFYCSGGCAANSYNFHGHINDAYDLGCELQRKRIECAIMIKAALADLEGEESNEEE
ncbi:MAG: thioether cross-link-forming SCIFF peptide maturase [Lachnospiraceae bacterium]|nr:thioether cross-link-forming SCIFF peptide maturase [Lachnospiraceae bacterium]